MKWFFYQLYHADFMRVKIIGEDTFAAICQFQLLVMESGKNLGDLLIDTEDAIRREFNRLLKALDQADRRAKLMNRILSNPHLLQYSTPETKGMIIYQLTRHTAADWAERSNHKGLSALFAYPYGSG